eukprot:1608054-Pyramimonas_sp.AAC.1
MVLAPSGSPGRLLGALSGRPRGLAGRLEALLDYLEPSCGSLEWPSCAAVVLFWLSWKPSWRPSWPSGGRKDYQAASSEWQFSRHARGEW